MHLHYKYITGTILVQVLTYVRVRHDDHYVGIGSEYVNESSKTRIPDFHALKLSLQLATAQFELFDNVADLLKPVHIGMRSSNCMGYDLL